MGISNTLKHRGFIHQIAGPSLGEVLDGQKRTIYHGIDPSADSAHAGNMVIWMLLLHLAKAGHKIVFLVGGGTGRIGDPKPDIERTLQDVSVIERNVEKIKKQAIAFFSGYGIEFVDNNDWLGELRLIDFLRDIGKHYTVNELIKKDAIATRLASDTGLSYTEFAYPLLQGFDYLRLFETMGCTVQVGGSDQWGNIVSGVELVRRKKQTEVYAITVPLVIDKTTGKKFGKSEGNAVWLDPEKTSPFKFYQFWYNTSDENVADFLKLYTFLELSEITEILEEFSQNPEKRNAQQKLAAAVTGLVHGNELAEAAEKTSHMLFGDEVTAEMSETEKKMLLENAPQSSFQAGQLLVDSLVEVGLATSKREARTFIENGAISVNSERVTTIEYILAKELVVNGLVLLKRGKRNIHLLVAE